MKYYLFLTLSVFFNVLTNTFFNLASKQAKTKYWLLFATGLFFGFLNSFFIIEAMKGIKYSIAYTVFSASSILLITLLANIYFQETMTVKKITGIVLVCVGIVLLVQEN